MRPGIVMVLSSLARVRSLRAPLRASSLRAVGGGRRLLSRKSAVADSAVGSRFITGHPDNNVTPYIANLVGRDLHKTAKHPLNIIKERIEAYFATLDTDFELFDGEDPVVTCTQCFDDLNIPPEHPGRSKSDTYYLTDELLLRTHTSAHQSEHLRGGHEAFLCTGDVYRRDEIDASHFPAFHQMEGVKLFGEAELGDDLVLGREAWLESAGVAAVGADLKQTLEGMIRAVFDDPDLETRWRDDFFPFTEPSFELDVFYQGEWLEVLGCGVMQQKILDQNYGEGKKAWAFGLGIERLAMILFDIPDIRLFWSGDERFLKQFKAGDLSAKFKSFSKFPPCNKDVSFWISDDFTENNLCETVRSIAGDIVEEVKLIDEFTNPKKGKTSHCYRIVYRSMERSLTDEEINSVQDDVRR